MAWLCFWIELIRFAVMNEIPLVCNILMSKLVHIISIVVIHSSVKNFCNKYCTISMDRLMNLCKYV